MWPGDEYGGVGGFTRSEAALSYLHKAARVQRRAAAYVIIRKHLNLIGTIFFIADTVVGSYERRRAVRPGERVPWI
ncbi:uncharacterized [Tachysurus ichikawai]